MWPTGKLRGILCTCFAKAGPWPPGNRVELGKGLSTIAVRQIASTTAIELNEGGVDETCMIDCFDLRSKLSGSLERRTPVCRITFCGYSLETQHGMARFVVRRW